MELTDSPAFRAWFGESKVVDLRGRPLIVYHGSPDAGAVFEAGGFRTSPTRGDVFFAVDSYRMALSYADANRAWDYQKAEPGVIPLYLSIQNPFVVHWGGKVWKGTAELIGWAKKEGHDGVIIHDVVDYYNDNLGRHRTKPGTVYAWFSPAQAKSAATGPLRQVGVGAIAGETVRGSGPNAGTFDSTSADLRRNGPGKRLLTMNPEWVGRALRQNWDKLIDAFGPAAMPRSPEEVVGDAEVGESGYYEYGTGAFGSVLPTHTPGLVMKVTDDKTEAAFVGVAMSFKEPWPPGMVRYHAVVGIEYTRAIGGMRTAFVLLRDEAFDVGRVVKRQDLGRLVTFATKAAEAHEKVTNPKSPVYSEAILVDNWLDEYVSDVRDIYNNRKTHEIGEAMLFYARKRIVFNDIHSGNVGRNAEGKPVITDPGGAYFLTDEYDSIRIKQLGADPWR